MDEALKKTLIAKAAEVRHNARAFSGFHVGAALLTKSGEIVTGCNVELHTTLSSICAERTAMVKAVSMGHTEFTAIAVVSDSDKPGTSTGRTSGGWGFAWPCWPLRTCRCAV